MTAATKTKAKVLGETVTPCPLSIHKGDTLQIDGKRVVVASDLVATFDHLNRPVWRFERTVPGVQQWGVIDVLATAEVLVLSRGGRP